MSAPRKVQWIVLALSMATYCVAWVILDDGSTYFGVLTMMMAWALAKDAIAAVEGT